MQTITALFDHYEQAADAVRALEQAGFASADIALIVATQDAAIGAQSDAANLATDIADDSEAGLGIGATIGGAGGLLAGLGALAIPGLGPVIAGGWLTSTLIGAVAGATLGGAAGGVVGVLTHSGVHEDDAQVFAEGVRRGGTLLSVRLKTADLNRAEKIFATHGQIDIAEKRREFTQSGWARFDPDAPAFVPDPLLGGRDWRNFPRRH